MSQHSIYVDDEVWAEVQKRATPLKDTPNMVLRRVLLPGEINREILTVLHNKGPMMAKLLITHVPYQLKSVYTKLLELEKVGLVNKDDEGVWRAEPPGRVEPIGRHGTA